MNFCDMRLRLSTFSSRSFSDEQEKCLYRMSLKLAHSVTMCFTVSWQRHDPHSDCLSPDMNGRGAYDRWRFEVCWWLLSPDGTMLFCVGSYRQLALIACNLFPVQLFHVCCQLSMINWLTPGNKLAAENLIGVNGTERGERRESWSCSSTRYTV